MEHGPMGGQLEGAKGERGTLIQGEYSGPRCPSSPSVCSGQWPAGLAFVAATLLCSFPVQSGSTAEPVGTTMT